MKTLTNFLAAYPRLFSNDVLLTPNESCRHFLAHVGFLGLDEVRELFSIEKNEMFLSSLQNLDSSPPRYHLNVAIIYIGCSQSTEV